MSLKRKEAGSNCTVTSSQAPVMSGIHFENWKSSFWHRSAIRALTAGAWHPPVDQSYTTSVSDEFTCAQAAQDKTIYSMVVSEQRHKCEYWTERKLMKCPLTLAHTSDCHILINDSFSLSSFLPHYRFIKSGKYRIVLIS